jgi:hypothetical protein
LAGTGRRGGVAIRVIYKSGLMFNLEIGRQAACSAD